MPPINLIFHVFVLFMGTLAASQATENDNLIQKTCKQTHFYNFCIKTLIGQPSIRKSPANLSVFADIFVEAGKAKMAEASQYVDKLLETMYQHDDGMKELLYYCRIDYDNDVGYLERVQLDLKHEMFIDAKVKLAAVVDDGKECEEGFERLNSFRKSPLTRRNKLIHQISTIVEDILDQILVNI